MRRDQYSIMRHRPLLPVSLGFDGLQRQHIVGRHPWQPRKLDHICGEIAEDQGGCACRIDDDALVAGGVAGRGDDADGRCNISSAVKQREHAMFA